MNLSRWWRERRFEKAYRKTIRRDLAKLGREYEGRFKEAKNGDGFDMTLNAYLAACKLSDLRLETIRSRRLRKKAERFGLDLPREWWEHDDTHDLWYLSPDRPAPAQEAHRPGTRLGPQAVDERGDPGHRALHRPDWRPHRPARGLALALTRLRRRKPRLMRLAVGIIAAAIAAASAFAQGTGGPRPRARDLGIAPGVFAPGPLNAITDVRGVRVGQATIVSRRHASGRASRPCCRTRGTCSRRRCPAPSSSAMRSGSSPARRRWRNSERSSPPIVLTNTLAVGTAVDAVVAYTLAQPGNGDVRSVNALVGETNDGGLNDIRGRHVTRDHVLSAIANAHDGPVEEGSVGAGTGTQCFGWKGGIGTASRVLPARYGGYALGVLVQTNFGGVLTIDGAPGREAARPLLVRAVGPGERGLSRHARRFLHDRRRHRCAARCARPQAAGRQGGIRPRPCRIVLQQRERRFRDRVLDRARICACGRAT